MSVLNVRLISAQGGGAGEGDAERAGEGDAERVSRSRCDSEDAASRAREAAGNARVCVQAQALGILQF